MIDLHTHTIFSDGELVPSELVRRAGTIGYEAIGITDHVDSSNVDMVVPNIVKVARELNRVQKVVVIPGAEVTHVPQSMIAEIVAHVRGLGAKVVLVHGETLVEPVEPGTNREAILAGVDILAHPGLISEEDLKLAREKGVTVEITARAGHSLTNGHVAKNALILGVPITLNTDSHSPGNLVTRDFADKVLLGAGVPASKLKEIKQHAENMIKKFMS